MILYIYSCVCQPRFTQEFPSLVTSSLMNWPDKILSLQLMMFSARSWTMPICLTQTVCHSGVNKCLEISFLRGSIELEFGLI